MYSKNFKNVTKGFAAVSMTLLMASGAFALDGSSSILINNTAIDLNDSSEIAIAAGGTYRWDNTKNRLYLENAKITDGIHIAVAIDDTTVKSNEVHIAFTGTSTITNKDDEAPAIAIEDNTAEASGNTLVLGGYAGSKVYITSNHAGGYAIHSENGNIKISAGDFTLKGARNGIYTANGRIDINALVSAAATADGGSALLAKKDSLTASTDPQPSDANTPLIKLSGKYKFSEGEIQTTGWTAVTGRSWVYASTIGSSAAVDEATGAVTGGLKSVKIVEKADKPAEESGGSSSGGSSSSSSTTTTSSSSGGGCNAGLAGIALLAILPLFRRRKK